MTNFLYDAITESETAVERYKRLLMKENKTEQTRTQVISETPSADKVAIFLNNQSPEGQRYYEYGRPYNETPVPAKTLRINDQSPIESKNPIKSKSAAEMFDHLVNSQPNKTKKFDPVDSSLHTVDEAPINYNTRTPDFDKIAKLLKADRSPGNGLLFQFGNSIEDTPESQRRRISPSNNERKTAAEFLNKLKENQIDKQDLNLPFQGTGGGIILNDGRKMEEKLSNTSTPEVNEASRALNHGGKSGLGGLHAYNDFVENTPLKSDVLNGRGPNGDRLLPSTATTDGQDIQHNEHILRLPSEEEAIADETNEVSSPKRIVSLNNDCEESGVLTVDTQPVNDVVIPATNPSMVRSRSVETQGSFKVEGNEALYEGSPKESKHKTSELTQGSQSNTFSADNKGMALNRIQSQPSSFLAVENCHTEGDSQDNRPEMRISETCDNIDNQEHQRWIFRFGNDNYNNQGPTQLINSAEEQGNKKIQKITESIDTQVDIDTCIRNLGETDEVETQLITSPISLKRPTQQKLKANSQFFDRDAPTQIIASPAATTQKLRLVPSPPIVTEHGNTADQNPINETSNDSHPKVQETQYLSDSSPSALKENGRNTVENDSQSRVRLKFSTKTVEPWSSQSDIFGTKRDTVTSSDAEMTQELPEIEEPVLQESNTFNKNHTMGSSETNFENRKQSHEEVDSSTYQTSFNEESQEIVKTRRSARRGVQKGKRTRVSTEFDGSQNKSAKPLSVTLTKKLKRPVETKDEASGGPESLDFVSREEGKHAFLSNTYSSYSQEPPVTAEHHQNIQDPFLRKNQPNKIEHQPFPTELKTSDNGYLTIDDIKFENSVWCQYSLNYEYYPGRVISYNSYSDLSKVFFETGESLIKKEDIHYLDIRVGDVVNWKGKPHTVVALECKSYESNAIRCIRGYDTVHLKRNNSNGNLGKRIILKPLASITLDLNEWAKRPKIILDGGSQSRANAFQDLRQPIRGRKNLTMIKAISPESSVKNEDGSHSNVASNRTISSENSICSLNDVSQRPLLSTCAYEKGNIFDKCLFVLTGLSEEYRRELSLTIEHQKGTVVENGFSSLFELGGENNSCQIFWKDRRFSDYKFAGLITERHLRSPKYIETLALGWPTLHWKFIEQCLKNGKLVAEQLHRFLLPSGESHRLSIDSNSRTGVIKSNNVFEFYMNLTLGLTLKCQLKTRPVRLRNYSVVIYGKSDVDSFIKFIFHTFEVYELTQFDDQQQLQYQSLNRSSRARSRSSDVATESIDEQTITQLQKLCPSSNDVNVLIYINEKSNKISVAQKLKQEIWSRLNHVIDNKLHVETKEWLIQSIINESTGFEDDLRSDFLPQF